MTLPAPSREDLHEWRTHPVTEAIEQCLRYWLDQRKGALSAAFLAGKQDLEAERLAYKSAVALIDDLFDSDADDIAATLERLTDDE